MNRQQDAFFDQLYLEHYKDLFRYAYRLTYEQNIAEEIIQDVFLEAYKKIDLLYKHENPVGWLYVAVRNISKAYMRESLRMKKLLPLENNAVAITDVECKELLSQNFLTLEESEIMEKFYIEKNSLAEISVAYGISLSACKMRLKRARDKFKVCYEKEK